jgi:hypothetical protein
MTTSFQNCAAVLAVVAQQYAAGLPAAHGLAQLRTPFLVAIAALQAAQILAHQLIAAIAGEALEGGIGIDHG